MPKHNPYKMTDKQYAFCQLYLSEFPRNQSKAYMAVYKTKSMDAASPAASRMMTNKKVKAYIDEKELEVQSALDEKYLASAERTLQEEGYLAYSDIGFIFNDDGSTISPTQLPEAVRRAIAGVEVVETTVAGVITRRYKYKLWDKGQALNRIEKVFGMQREKVEHGIDDDLRTLLKEIDGQDRGTLPCERE